MTTEPTNPNAVYNYQYLLREWRQRRPARPADLEARALAAIEEGEINTLRAAWEAVEEHDVKQGHDMKTALYCHMCSANAPEKCLAYRVEAAPSECQMRTVLYSAHAA
jgi:hypothetical protein